MRATADTGGPNVGVSGGPGCTLHRGGLHEQSQQWDGCCAARDWRFKGPASLGGCGLSTGGGECEFWAGPVAGPWLGGVWCRGARQAGVPWRVTVLGHGGWQCWWGETWQRGQPMVPWSAVSEPGIVARLHSNADQGGWSVSCSGQNYHPHRQRISPFETHESYDTAPSRLCRLRGRVGWCVWQVRKVEPPRHGRWQRQAVIGGAIEGSM